MLMQARQARRERAKTKAKKDGKTKEKKSNAFSDYARPSVPTGSYRPAKKATVNEDDFMASLLSTVTSEPSRKRKSSPEPPSSEAPAPSSDSFFSRSVKRYGESSDDEFWDAKRGQMGKRPRVSEATVKPDPEEDSDAGVDFGDNSMDVDDGIVVKAEPEDSDDEMVIKPAARRAAAPANRRQMVNSTAVKNVKKEAEPEEDVEMEVKKPTPMMRKPAVNRANWQAVQNALVDNSLDSVRAPQGSTKPEMVLADDGSLPFFWLDFAEENGVVDLIGKVLNRQTGKFVSACVSIHGIQRNLFVKPREKRFCEWMCGLVLIPPAGGRETDIDVSKTDVFEEFGNLRDKLGIEEWAAKFVNRKYAFEVADVPRGETEWMKVVYGFDQPEIPMDTTGQTFSHIFGTNSSAFELLVVKRKIMGPCWLNIKGAQASENVHTWCKVEFTVKEPKNVNPFDEGDPAAPKAPPPLTIMSIALRTIVNHRENKTEILVATTRTWEGMNIEDPTPPDRLPSSLNTIVRPIEKFPPGLEQRAKSERSPFQTVKAERALLNSLLATIQRHDPDVIVGHSFLGNTFEVLLYRLKELKADNWSRIGRFRRKVCNISKAGRNERHLAGRLVAELSGNAGRVWFLSSIVLTAGRDSDGDRFVDRDGWHVPQRHARGYRPRGHAHVL